MTPTLETTAPATATSVDPSADELIASARSLRERLRELQAEHAELGTYSQEIHEAFVEHRLYDLLRPKRYGGLEVSLETFFRVAIEISRGDPGVGWSWELGASHAYQFASHFPERAQEEAFGSAEPFIAASRAFPLRADVQRVDGGYTLSGRWNFNSGCTYSTHFMPVAPVTHEDGSTELHMFILPRKDFTILDDWGAGKTIGLHASSSNSIEIEGAFVPEHNVVPFNFKDLEWGEDATPGYRLHRNPLYLGRTSAFFIAGLTQTQIGAALACKDEYEKLMERGSSFPPRIPRSESPEYQLWYGQVVSLAESSETLMLGALREFEQLNTAWTVGGAEFTTAEDVRLRGQIVQAAKLAQQAIEIAFSTAGSSASGLAGTKLGKYSADAAMYRTHIGAQHDVLLGSLGRVLLGQPLTM
ncbi:acyl-CoA dehydrogenase family protein [Leucobacter triazinivorans]|uniref:Hydroxylase n=1 Tax=Leucobacter triazinivorans TaxID=1784719 RepID=A0A4P6KF05_9MICO|nr:acyl-CoA dehydrogenase family protein [Leucobacter triazinivorans]QBE49045.1 hydroxylase [Leucobacter triazinivorans]